MQPKLKLMNFPTPADSDSTNNQPTEAAETETETLEWYETLSDEANEAFQNYWAVVDTYRGLKKLCLTHLFDNPDGVSNSEIASLRDRSPIADHWVFYQEQKETQKEAIQQLRDDDEISTQAGLRGYKANVDADFDHTILSEDNAQDNGVKPDTFYDDEDPIFMPEAYEFPTDSEGNLEIWSAQSGDKLSDSDRFQVISDAEGVGDKTAENVIETLTEAGVELVWE